MNIKHQKFGNTRQVIVTIAKRRGFTIEFGVPRCWSWDLGPEPREYRLPGPLGYYYESFTNDSDALDWANLNRLPLQRLIDECWHSWCYTTRRWLIR